MFLLNRHFYKLEYYRKKKRKNITHLRKIN